MPANCEATISSLVEPHDAMRFDMADDKFIELMDSIRVDGVLCPLFIVPLTLEYFQTWPEQDPSINGRLLAGEQLYEVRAGHRRLLACRQLQISSVPCRLFTPDEPAYAGLMATENLIREEVSAYEEGVLFTRIKETPGITEEEMRRKCGGKSLPYIYERIALVAGDEEVALAVHRGEISLGVAKKLNQIRYPAPGQQGEKFIGDALTNAIASADAYRRMFLERAQLGGATVQVATGWVNDWRQSAGIVVQSSTVAVEPMPSGGYALPNVICALCREEGQPHEMETITVHRNELAAFRAALAAQGNEPAN